MPYKCDTTSVMCYNMHKPQINKHYASCNGKLDDWTKDKSKL